MSNLITQPGQVLGPRSVTIIRTDPLVATGGALLTAARVARTVQAISLSLAPIENDNKFRGDVTMSQTHTRQMNVTSHAVESPSNIQITDHVRRAPDVLQFSSLITDTAFSIIGTPGFLGRAGGG